MNKQHVEGVHKWRKAYLMSLDNIATSIRDNVWTVKRIKAKGNLERLSDCHVTPYKPQMEIIWEK